MNKHMMVVINSTAILAMGSLWAGESKTDLANADSPGVALYHADPSHLWNRIHRAFFVRSDADTANFDFDMVDPPLWRDTSGFLKSGASHQAALAVLDEFLANDGHALVADPLKRAVLQHDLWSVFDWSANTYQDKSNNESSVRNLVALRSRLAAAIQRLALTAEKISTLPDNLANTVSGGAFSPVYEPEQPRKPFLPAKLLDPKGPWVCVRGAFPGPSGPVHTRHYQGRSPFLVFLQLPGGRKATLNYLHDLNRATSKLVGDDSSHLPQFPVGTVAALLRQMTVIDDTGRIQVTPLTQTLQMRVYRLVGSEVTDHKNSQAAVKFRMKRESLFADGHQGLEAIDWSEPLRISLLQHNDVYERKSADFYIKTTMQSCIACHSCGGATVQSVFTYQQDDWVPGAQQFAMNQLRLTATNPVAEAKRTLAWKRERKEWGMLKGLLEKR
jgi:hypothetical protein